MIKTKSRTWFRDDPPELLYNSLHDAVLGLRHVGFVVSVKETETCLDEGPNSHNVFTKSYLISLNDSFSTIIWEDVICENSLAIKTTLSAKMEGDNEILNALIDSFFDQQK